MAKKMKRIGWITETRKTVDQKWYVVYGTHKETRLKSMVRYNERKWPTDNNFVRLKAKGLARCVPVWVEVDDG
jgi:hypothetical protein